MAELEAQAAGWNDRGQEPRQRLFSVIENKKGGIDMDKALERELIQKGRDF